MIYARNPVKLFLEKVLCISPGGKAAERTEAVVVQESCTSHSQGHLFSYYTDQYQLHCIFLHCANTAKSIAIPDATMSSRASMP